MQTRDQDDAVLLAVDACVEHRHRHGDHRGTRLRNSRIQTKKDDAFSMTKFSRPLSPEMMQNSSRHFTDERIKMSDEEREAMERQNKADVQGQCKDIVRKLDFS